MLAHRPTPINVIRNTYILSYGRNTYILSYGTAVLINATVVLAAFIEQILNPPMLRPGTLHRISILLLLAAAGLQNLKIFLAR